MPTNRVEKITSTSENTQARKVVDSYAAIADYTITWTTNAPTPGSTNTIADGDLVGDNNDGGQAIADLTAKVNLILAALRHGGIIQPS